MNNKNYQNNYGYDNFSHNLSQSILRKTVWMAS